MELQNLIIDRRFNSKLSLQVAPIVSHYKIVENTMRNDMVAMGASYRISSQTSITDDYNQQIAEFLMDNPSPGISLGLEFSISAHTFQQFITNYQGIVS